MYSRREFMKSAVGTAAIGAVPALSLADGREIKLESKACHEFDGPPADTPSFSSRIRELGLEIVDDLHGVMWRKACDEFDKQRYHTMTSFEERRRNESCSGQEGMVGPVGDCGAPDPATLWEKETGLVDSLVALSWYGDNYHGQIKWVWVRPPFGIAGTGLVESNAEHIANIDDMLVFALSKFLERGIPLIDQIGGRAMWPYGVSRPVMALGDWRCADHPDTTLRAIGYIGLFAKPR